MGTRRYKPNPKHKSPKGYGSICPDGVHPFTADLLESGEEDGKSIYNVGEGQAFRANNEDGLHWHGFPIPWRDLPPSAAKALIAAGRLTEHDFKKNFRKGR